MVVALLVLILATLLAGPIGFIVVGALLLTLAVVTGSLHLVFEILTLPFRIVGGPDATASNPFVGPDSDQVIVSLDTLTGEKVLGRLQADDVTPYDLVVFDESHKLAADREADLSLSRQDRHRLAIRGDLDPVALRHFDLFEHFVNVEHHGGDHYQVLDVGAAARGFGHHQSAVGVTRQHYWSVDRIGELTHRLGVGVKIGQAMGPFAAAFQIRSVGLDPPGFEQFAQRLPAP